MLKRFTEKIEKIKSSLIFESSSIDSLFEKLIKIEDFEELKKNKALIDEFKQLSDADAALLLDKLFDKSIEKNEKNEQISLIYHYLKEIDESRQS